MQNAAAGWIFLALTVFLSPACGVAPGWNTAGGSGAGAGAADEDIQLLVAPDQSTEPILAGIRRARRRVLAELYMLTDAAAVDALLAARAAGAEVHVLLEPAPYLDEAANQAAFTRLGSAGVDVRWAVRARGLTHIKAVIADDTLFVMTLNLTAAGLGKNREYVVLDRRPSDIQRAAALWAADASGMSSTTASAPAAATVGSTLVTSPDDSRAALTDLIDGARSSILVEMEELSDPALLDRLVAASARGIAVACVVPATGTSSLTTAAVEELRVAGVRVGFLDAPPLHAKAIVTDAGASTEGRAFVGSINLTRASLDDNRELGVVLGGAAEVERLRATIAADLEIVTR